MAGCAGACGRMTSWAWGDVTACPGLAPGHSWLCEAMMDGAWGRSCHPCRPRLPWSGRVLTSSLGDPRGEGRPSVRSVVMSLSLPPEVTGQILAPDGVTSGPLGPRGRCLLGICSARDLTCHSPPGAWPASSGQVRPCTCHSKFRGRDCEGEVTTWCL